MKYLLLFIALSLSTQASEYKYSIGGNQSRVDYCWYGASEACFEYELSVVRFEIEHESGFALRFGKALNKPSDTQTTITNQVFNIHFSKYEEYEIIYKYYYRNSLVIYAGIGHYKQSLPIYSSSKVLLHYDEDNGTGFSVGGMYNLSDNLSIDFMIKQTSSIGDAGGSCDAECISNWEAKGSTIRQAGMGFMYKF